MTRRIVSGSNDLASQNAGLTVEWHPTKNGTVTPEQVSAGSHQKAWWQCQQGHEWEAVIKSRNNGLGCPICSGKMVLINFNDLATTNSTLAEQWHPTKNGELTAQHVTRGSSKKVWWLGPCGHEWQAIVQGRNRSATCPICAGRKLLVGYNDLATTNSTLTEQWHPTKNGELTAQQVLYGSEKRVWWLGACGHEWDATVAGRNNGSGCPICSGTRVSVGINDLASQYPDLVPEWHPTKNGELAATDVTGGSERKVWWRGACGHEWDARISGRTKGVGCPVCSNHRIVIGINDLASQYPDVASEWHPTKNGELIPQQVGSGGEKRVWWKCEIGHEWQAAINQRRRGHGCPTCSRIIVGVNDLAAGNPTLAEQWHPTKNGDLIPRQVGVSAGKKVWWLGACGHEWDAVIYTRNNGVGCPICSGRKVLVGFNDLAFTNPEIAAQWHPTKNGEQTAQQFTLHSNKKVWWQCSKGHEWETAVSNRSRNSKGNGCRVCSGSISKGEKEVADLLIDLGLNVESSNRTILKSKNQELDIYLPEKKVAIEFNGVHWHKERYKGKTHHYDRWIDCQSAGVQLWQIWEDDWELHSDIIIKTLKHSLGYFNIEENSTETVVGSITPQQAETFLNATHIQEYASGQHYFALIDAKNVENIRAILVLDDESDMNGYSSRIIRYATKDHYIDDFSKLVTHAINTLNLTSLVAIADNCGPDYLLYERTGFRQEDILPPDYTYFFLRSRKNKSDYPLERFRDDPKLLWEEGLTEMELADLNGLDRIWDAGKTLYRLVL